MPHSSALARSDTRVYDTWSTKLSEGIIMHAMRVSGAILPVLLLMVLLLFAAPADAEPRIKVSGCKIYATNHVDPIAFTDHLHRHFGNRSTTNRTTGASLFNRKTTSCKENWFTSAGWFPAERGEPILSCWASA
jgi:hypothetical protein